MHPICFHIGSRPIYWYGVMVALGFMVGSWVATRRARLYGIRPEQIADLVVWLIVAGVLGGRLVYVISHFGEYVHEPLEIIRIDHGGLVFYGGLAGAVAATILFAKIRQVSLWAVADVMAVPVPLGHAFGRVGCLLNGCCYGRPSDLPWAITLGDVRRHPSQAYLAIGNLVVMASLIWLERRSQAGRPPRLRPGMLFWVYAGLYGVMRFSVEFSRGDYGYWLPGHLSVSQLASVILIAVAAVFLRVLASDRDPRAAE